MTMSKIEWLSIIFSGISAISAFLSALAAWLMWKTQKLTVRASLYKERKKVMDAFLAVIYYWIHNKRPPLCDAFHDNVANTTWNNFKTAKNISTSLFPKEIFNLFEEYQSLAFEYCILNEKDKQNSKYACERRKQITDNIASTDKFDRVLKTFMKHMAIDE